jgi:hypothetical protein
MRAKGVRTGGKGDGGGWKPRRGKGRKDRERKEIQGNGKKKRGRTFRPSLPPKRLSDP